MNSAFTVFMRYVARVEVGLKPGHSDPEGETTRDSLAEMNYAVESVKVGKVYELFVEASSLEEAEKMVDEMCRRLLANPVKDNYKVSIEESR
ncbi:phosphoribosylformylglycinamidine synthase subunit PurS [Candidatus Bathyarchaeota archaeon]|nr:phosphoribosylformylglycinamidine synthase subunit PurS [Candidatus Bathyarchaeota archaeon]